MFYGFLADVVGLIHFGYVSFVVFGLLLTLLGIGLRWRWVRNLKFRVMHLLMIMIVALESVGEVMCPLTTWEKNLRVLAGQPATGDSFVADLLNNIMFFNSIANDHWIFKSAYVSFAALVVMTLILAPPRRKSRAPANLEVSRGFFATALLGTLAFIFVYTAWCMEDYKKSWDDWREKRYQEAQLSGESAQSIPPTMEDRVPVYFTAFTGIHLGGLALVCWALRSRGGRAGINEEAGMH